jgi:hypothetical protein
VSKVSQTYPNNNAKPTGSIQMNKLHPISVFDTKAATEPNINMPPTHIDTKNTPLDAMITFDLRLYIRLVSRNDIVIRLTI